MAESYTSGVVETRHGVDPHPPVFEFSPWYRNSSFQVVAGLSLLAIVTLMAFAMLSYRQRGKLIAELHRKKRLEADRQAILEMIARRKPLPGIFQRIARSIAVNCPGSLAGVIRINEGKLNVAAGSTLPDAFARDLQAIHASEAGFDELWANLHLAASRHSLAGCHFSPIRSGGDELLGAIAVFLRQVPGPAGPNRPRQPADLPILSGMSKLAGASIDSARLYERLAYQAGHDALTGLPNRLMFESRLQDALVQARQDGRRLAVFFLDLDRFKLINDSLGHRVGDLFLKQVACRLSCVIPETATLARIGGDEFTLLLWQETDPAWAEETAGRMLEALRPPCVIEGDKLFASASIGISLYPQDGDDPAALQKRADSAMYRAKVSGKNRYEFFSADMVLSATTALELEPVLRDALDQGRFELHYQPQLGMDGELAGLEALLRLRHPDLGLTPPTHFMGLAEETGLIVPIGEWVLWEACSQIQRWRRQGFTVPKVSVNVSSVQLGVQSGASSLAAAPL